MYEFFLFPFLLEVLLPGGVRAPGQAKTRIRAIRNSYEFRCHSAMFRGRPFFRQNDELDRPRQRFFFCAAPSHVWETSGSSGAALGTLGELRELWESSGSSGGALGRSGELGG